MKLIDGDALKRKAQKVATKSWKTKITASVETILNQFIEWIEEAQTIDAVEVVRCKDCKHWKKTVGDERWSLGDCDVFDKKLVMCEGFCSWGVRREEDDG